MEGENAPEHVPENNETKILEFLKLMKVKVRTLAIAKEIAGPKATCKTVNPILYKLMRDGKVFKCADENGVNPHWYI